MNASKTIGRPLAACALGLVLLGATGCSNVRVLNAPNQQSASSPGNSAATQLVIGPFQNKAVVMITADGRSAYLNPTMRQSGIVLTIREPRRLLAQDSTFEFHSFRRVFQSAAAYNFILPQGQSRTIQARVDPVGAGGPFNQATSVRMTAVAIAAQ